MSTRIAEPTTNVWQEPSPEAAYARFEPERQALSLADLLPVNLDVPTVVTRVYGVCSRLRQLQPRLGKDPRGIALSQLDRLEDLARALSWAHARRKATREPKDHLAALYAEGCKLRDDLHGDLLPLIRRGLVPQPGPRLLTGRTGYLNVSSDLQALGVFLRRHALRVTGQTHLQVAELERAERLAARLLRTVGQRAQAPKVVAAASEERQRAFTLLLRDYDELRRAVSFLRWHQGDAEKLAPSLWKGRGRRRRATIGVKPEAATARMPLVGGMLQMPAMDSKRVLAEALRLAPDARAALAGELLASLEEAPVDDGREAAWSQEIRQRLDAWERGQMDATPGDEFMTRLVGAASGKAAP